MNRTGPRVVGGVVLLEIFVIIVLLIFRTCCPADLDRFASASEGAELVLFQQPTDIGPNPFLDVPDRTRAGKMGEIALTVIPKPASSLAVVRVNPMMPALAAA